MDDASSRHVPGPPDDFVDGVLARTSGPACRGARTRLGGTGEPVGDALDVDLVQGHLDGCESCRAVALALALLAETLPAMRELDPPGDLVADVLARTVAAPVPAPRDGLVETLRARWASLVLGRRRLAWEVGYVGALMVWLVCGTSWAPLATVPARALAVIQHNHVGAAVNTVTDLISPVSHRAEGAQ